MEEEGDYAQSTVLCLCLHEGQLFEKKRAKRPVIPKMGEKSRVGRHTEGGGSQYALRQALKESWRLNGGRKGRKKKYAGAQRAGGRCQG